MATGRVLLFQWLLLLAFSSVLVLAKSHYLPGFRHVRRNLGEDDTISPSLQTFYYNQTLDHFNFQPQSFATFPQRYMVDSTYWGGADKNAPIFVFLGLKGSLEDTLQFVGFLSENAHRFKALIVYIEHRFYGKSVPFVTQEESIKNETLRGYLNSAQALADYAEVLVYLKKKLSATYSPIIVIGASYGGMLATWFRLKYPHIAVGALASSAPLLYLDEIVSQDAFFNIIANDFMESSGSCGETIMASWDEIHRVASKPDGLSILSKKFKTCQKLNDVYELLAYLKLGYLQVASINMPPIYPLDVLCRGIDGAPDGTDVLGRIFSGMVALLGKKSCYVNVTEVQLLNDPLLAENWQECSDFVWTINFDYDATFPPPPFNLESYVKQCESKYGVSPRPHWITTYFGGHDMKLVLKRFGSNIIFTNGLKDPWSGGGILKDISDSLVAAVTKNDLFKAQKTDPDWLVKQRKKSLKIIEGWIKQYYKDLRALNLI